MRDSIIKAKDLIERLKEIGQDTIAITDHGNVCGSVSFYKALKQENIRMIYGCEMYTCDDLAVKDNKNRYYHLLILCMNETGRKNLNKLISISERPENTYYKPRIDFELLKQYSEGLLVSSACMAGEISRYLEVDDYKKAKQTALKYKSVFGDNYYLEVQSHNDELQMALNKKIHKLSVDLGIECIVTCDAHYVWQYDKDYQNKYAFYGNYKEDGEAYTDCFVQSEADVRERLWYFTADVVDRIIDNTHVVANKCNIEMPLSAPIMPQINTPPQFKNNREWLENICEEGFVNKLDILSLEPEQKKVYYDRYEYEMNALDRMGFIDYILMVRSYISIVDDIGPGRGSAAGSLVCYLAGITDVNPIEYNLYFERFIDVGALDLLDSGTITKNELKLPDIDIDTSEESRETILQYLCDTYGEYNVASIGRFGTNKTKGTIRDMCRTLDIPLTISDSIAKSFEDYEIDEIDKILESGEKIPPSAQAAVNYVQQYPELFKYVRKLSGLPKSFGLHPCGKVISVRPLDEFLPSCYDSSGIRYLQGDMKDVESVGLVKVDVLGLRTVQQMYDTLALSNKTKEYIRPQNQDYFDQKVLDIFRKGDTVGIFQFSSHGMRETLKKMGVSGIEDLAIANALFRPGSLAYIDNFCRRRMGQERLEYLHPDLEPILKNTNGIIVFQEQLIGIGRLAGLRNPDTLRKAVGKKNLDLMMEVKVELEEKLKLKGWSDEQFNKLWDDMLEMAKYMFNKSHAVAYAILAYLTAKQKAYYPAEFFAGLCNSYINQSSFVKDDAGEIASDMFKHKIRLVPFDYRQDHRRCTVNKNQILYAIPLIKECNKHVADALYSVRDRQYDYFWTILKDLYALGVDRAQMQILIKLDFFRVFGNSKKLLRIADMLKFFNNGEVKSIKKEKLNEYEYLVNIVKKYANDIGKNGNELKSFKVEDISAILNESEEYIMSANIEDFSFNEKIAMQREYLGFAALVTGNEADRPKLFVKNIFPLFKKANGQHFGYSIVAQSIGSGIETRYTVFNRTYNKAPINEDDIIKCVKYSQKGKYFTLEAYEKIS